jgi:hypothetical protein
LAAAGGTRRHSQAHALAIVEFQTLRLHLIKLAARVIETTKRMRIAFAASCRQAELFVGIARWLQPAEP